MALIVKGLEGSERGVQAKESVKVEHLVFRDRDTRPHRVVVLLAVGDDDVEAVSRAALKDHDETAVWYSRGLRKHGAQEKTGDGRCACECKGSIAQKKTPDCLHRPVSLLAALKLR